MKKYIFIMVTIVIIGFGTSYANEGQGGAAGAFLRLGVGTKAIGLGSAFTALADDGSAIYWNPSGLGQINKLHLSGMYSLMTMGRKLNFASIVMPTSVGSIGISWLNFGVNDIEGRDSYSNLTQNFSDNETAFQIGYGTDITKRLLIGVAYKYIVHTLANSKATGNGFDGGILLKVLPNRLHFGASVQNISTKLGWDTETNIEQKIPMIIRVGALIQPTDNFFITLDVDKFDNSQEIRYFAGAQILIGDVLAIRGGYNSDAFTFGGSIYLSSIKLHYAFNDEQYYSQGSIHRIGVSVLF